jgi:putative transcriptional regulator
MHETSSYLKGHFLMAMPALADPNFEKSVTCISEHNADGAVGIVLNQVHEGLTAAMVFAELGMACDWNADDIAIHIGGPVHTNQLFVLHGPPLAWEGSLPITDSLAMSNSRDILEAIAAKHGPYQFLISLGCAGWAPGQLEWEVTQNSWLTTPCDLDVIFKVPVEYRWETAIRKLGIDPSHLSDTGGYA